MICLGSSVAGLRVLLKFEIGLPKGAANLGFALEEINLGEDLVLLVTAKFFLFFILLAGLLGVGVN